MAGIQEGFCLLNLARHLTIQLQEMKTENLLEAHKVLLEWKTEKEEKESENLLRSIEKQLAQKFGLVDPEFEGSGDVQTDGGVFCACPSIWGNGVCILSTIAFNVVSKKFPYDWIKFFRVVNGLLEEVKPVITWEVV